jgi:hypothetical protein
LEVELDHNAKKKLKEDDLTEKIHHFSNIECDFSKQIHCNDGEIAYLEHMNKHLESGNLELTDTLNMQRMN